MCVYVCMHVCTFFSFLSLLFLFYSRASISQHCFCLQASQRSRSLLILTASLRRLSRQAREVELNTFDLGRATGATQWRPGPSINTGGHWLHASVAVLQVFGSVMTGLIASFRLLLVLVKSLGPLT